MTSDAVLWLERSIRACWGNKQVHILRQWLLTLEPSVGNGSAAWEGHWTPPLPTPDCSWAHSYADPVWWAPDCKSGLTQKTAFPAPPPCLPTISIIQPPLLLNFGGAVTMPCLGLSTHPSSTLRVGYNWSLCYLPWAGFSTEDYFINKQKITALLSPPPSPLVPPLSLLFHSLPCECWCTYVMVPMSPFTLSEKRSPVACFCLDQARWPTIPRHASLCLLSPQVVHWNYRKLQQLAFVGVQLRRGI